MGFGSAVLGFIRGRGQRRSIGALIPTRSSIPPRYFMRVTLVARDSHDIEAYESRLAKEFLFYKVPLFLHLSTEPSSSRPLVAVCRAVSASDATLCAYEDVQVV